MSINEADMKADMNSPDRGEPASAMDPPGLSRTSRHLPALEELAVELATRSAAFRASLAPGLVAPLADLVRAMNCYYSNLIEGHDTHPVEIERALRKDYSADPRARDLQLEARAHVAVQAWIDAGGLAGRAATAEAAREIHRRFGELLPAELLTVTNPDTGARATVVPGAWRTRDVKVGRHVPVSPGAVPRLMARFESAYAGLGRRDMVIATAAVHHRLLWIHPFLDGNGRVARLMSHALLLEALETGGLWSVARGLARRQAEYKRHLADCDLPRRNDLDGRGPLGEEALAEFTRFFLETCLDQVTFMRSLVEPERLRGRIRRWAEEEIDAGLLPPSADRVLEQVLLRGTLPRREVGEFLGVTDRHARRITRALQARGVLRSAGVRAPLELVFPAALAHRWLPGLFPEQPDAA